MQYKDFKRKAQAVTQQAWTEKFYSEAPDNLSEYLITTKIDVTGGMEGGSCWDEDDLEYYYIRDPEPFVFTYLQILLKTVLKETPSLELLYFIFDSMRDQLVEIPGYYGNQDNYRYKAISLNQLYAILKPLM